MFNTGKLNGSTLEDYMPNVCTESPLKGRLYLKHDNETWCFRKFVKIYFLVSIFLFFQIVILKLSFSGSAFCKHHCSIVEQLEYKTGLREFLKSFSDKETDVNPNLYCRKMKSRVNSVLDEIARACKSDKSNSATDAQGRPHFMPYLSFWRRLFPFLLVHLVLPQYLNVMSLGTTYLLCNRKIATTENFELVGEGEDCNKYVFGLHFHQHL